MSGDDEIARANLTAFMRQHDIPDWDALMTRSTEDVAWFTDAVLEHLDIDRRFLVVELNGEPVARNDLDATVLREGDRLELVRPVAGG